MPGAHAMFAFLTRSTPRRLFSWLTAALFAGVLFLGNPAAAFAQASPQTSGEANLILPDLHQATFFNGLIDGQSLLLYSLIFVVLGLLFGVVIYVQLKNLPVPTIAAGPSARYPAGIACRRSKSSQRLDRHNRLRLAASLHPL